MKTIGRQFLVVALLTGALGAPPAAAQFGPGGTGIGAPEHHLVRVGFGGGVSVPTSHAADALKSGVNGQAYVVFDLGVPLRFNLGYQKFDYKDAILGGGATDGQSSMLSGVGGLMLNLPQVGPLGAYVTAGLGAFHLKDAQTLATGSVSVSHLRWGIDGGAGITLKMGRLQAFVEGRVQNVYTEKGAIDASTVTAVPVTFGILF
jgi:hypothetical protein